MSDLTREHIEGMRESARMCGSNIPIYHGHQMVKIWDAVLQVYDDRDLARDEAARLRAALHTISNECVGIPDGGLDGIKHIADAALAPNPLAALWGQGRDLPERMPDEARREAKRAEHAAWQIVEAIATDESEDVLIEKGSRFAVSCMYCDAPARWEDGEITHRDDCLWVRARALRDARSKETTP